MAYISSDEIAVFPCGGRSELYPNSKLTTEFNLTNIINRLIDVESFVINKEYETNGLVNDLEFNLKGYYFKVNSNSVTSLVEQFSSETSIYAIIKLDTTISGDYHFQELINVEGGHSLDVNGNVFQGVKFDTSPSNVAGEFSLEILKKIDSTWNIPENSKVKFKSIASENNRSIIIDDGELD